MKRLPVKCGPGLGEALSGERVFRARGAEIAGGGCLPLSAHGGMAGVVLRTWVQSGMDSSRAFGIGCGQPGPAAGGELGDSAHFPAPVPTLRSSMAFPSGECSWKPQCCRDSDLHTSRLGLLHLCDCDYFLSPPTSVWVPQGRKLAHALHCTVPGHNQHSLNTPD